MNAPPALSQNVANKCGRGGFTIRSRHPDHSWARWSIQTVERARKQFDVADHLNPFKLRLSHNYVRLRVGQRHAGRDNKRGKFRPRPFFGVGGSIFRVFGFSAGSSRFIPTKNFRARRHECLARRQASQAEAENRDLFLRNMGKREHGFCRLQKCPIIEASMSKDR